MEGRQFVVKRYHSTVIHFATVDKLTRTNLLKNNYLPWLIPTAFRWT